MKHLLVGLLATCLLAVGLSPATAATEATIYFSLRAIPGVEQSLESRGPPIPGATLLVASETLFVGPAGLEPATNGL